MFEPSNCPHLFKVHKPDDEYPPIPDEIKQWICPLCGVTGRDITTPVGYQEVYDQFHFPW